MNKTKTLSMQQEQKKMSGYKEEKKVRERGRMYKRQSEDRGKSDK